MFEQVGHLGPVPAGHEGELLGEQARHVDPEPRLSEVDHDEGEQERGHRHAEKGQAGQRVVSPRIRTHGRVDAGRQRHRPSEQDRGDCDDHGQKEPVTHHLVDTAIVFHREPQVALEQTPVPLVERGEPDQTGPPQVAPGDRLIQVKIAAQILDFGRRGLRALHLEFEHAGGEVIARGKPHDRKDHHRDGQHGGNHQEQPAADERMAHGHEHASQQRTDETKRAQEAADRDALRRPFYVRGRRRKSGRVASTRSKTTKNSRWPRR